MSSCTNRLLIDLKAIRTNFDILRSKLPPKNRLMAMVKAQAYGTNKKRLAPLLATFGIDIFGVSSLQEAKTLRQAGLGQSLFVFSLTPDEVKRALKLDVEVGVSEGSLIEQLAKEAARQQKPARVHLHVDTGMSRLGCRPEDAVRLAKKIATSPYLILEGIMTHFACAENPSQDTFTRKQADIFERAIADVEAATGAIPWKHAANSAAVARFEFPAFNMVRVGLATFGLYPSAATKEALELRQAVSLLSRIVGINRCQVGDTVSYGRTYQVEKETQTLAVIPLGYFDGLHRAYSDKGHVMIHGKKAPRVGKICMDFMMVDITDIPKAAIGDPVLIFGQDGLGNSLSPEELITCLGPRIQRKFIYEGQQAR